MTIWRVVSASREKDLVQGLGGLYAAGRWHEKGVPIIYAADHPSTAVLELLVNVSAAKLSTGSYVAVPLDVAEDEIRVMDARELPADWRLHPHPDSTRAMGMRWIREGERLAMSVPSAVLPIARNFVLNSRHPGMAAVRVGSAQPLQLDERLVRGTTT